MLVGALCGLLFLVAGGLAYAGRGRSIVLKGFPTPVLFFGLAWLGAGGLVVILSSQLSQAGHPVAGTLLALPGVVGVVVFLLSFAWMPRRLQPGGTATGATVAAMTRSTRPSQRECNDAGAPVDRAGRARARRGERRGSRGATGMAPHRAAKGRLTDPGLPFSGTLAQPQGQVHVDAAVGRIPFSCQAFLRGDHAVVVATASPQPWSGSDPDAEQVVALADTVTIDDVPVGYLPGTGPLGRAGNPRVTGPSPFFGWTADSLHRRACDQSCAGMPFSGRGR